MIFRADLGTELGKPRSAATFVASPDGAGARTRLMNQLQVVALNYTQPTGYWV